LTITKRLRPLDSGAAWNFREGPVTDVVRVQSLTVLHKDHFDVTVQFLVYYNMMSNIFCQSALNSWNEWTAPAKILASCFGGGHDLFGLVLAMLLPLGEDKVRWR